MCNTAQSLTKEESLTLALRRLFEQRGYQRYRMSNFESYDMYRENKSFLNSEGVLTFTDASGRLMALKPDVTMSIVKNTRETATSAKLYYQESVFRTAAHTTDYREINQMGVEFLGAVTPYIEAEMVLLAAQSLAAIGAPWILEVSHMAFAAGLLEAIGLSEIGRKAAEDALRGKNAHTLAEIATAEGINAADVADLLALTTLSGSLNTVLQRARAMVRTEEMATALDSLACLNEALCAVGGTENVQVDFSLLNDMDYYNGLIFQGYVKGVPHAVLAGGRYDNLMRKFAKPQEALGFALYLGELDRLLAEQSAYDADVLLLYSADTAPATVAKAVQSLLSAGKSVRAEQSAVAGIRTKQTLRLLANGQTEVASC